VPGGIDILVVDDRPVAAEMTILALQRSAPGHASKLVDHMTKKTQASAALKDLLTVDVLVIDDADASADLTLLAIHRAAPSAKVVRFRDANKALRFVFLAESGPKLVLLELGSPFDLGLHILERLRSSPRTSTIPVIVLTATLDPSAVQASQALGANGFIAKPEGREEYCAEVKAVVERWLAK
jgi:CheY-like chemotaxis protein